MKERIRKIRKMAKLGYISSISVQPREQSEVLIAHHFFFVYTN